MAYARVVPLRLAWPMLETSGVKHVLRRSVAMFTGGFVRLARWAFGPVDDEHVTNVIPMPGPAHGPVSAIDLRSGTSAGRRPSRF